MPTACIQQDGAKASLEYQHIVVTWIDDDGENLKRSIPLHDLDRLILSETVTITSRALAECLRRNIPVSLLDPRGRFIGAFHPPTPDHGAFRLRHYQRTLDPNFVLTIASRIIKAKIYNQRRLVQRIAANRKAEKIPVPDIIAENLNTLERSMDACLPNSTLDTLRGHEGIAAARYFAAWAALLPKEFPFERRSTRPPMNPVNAALSFSATLLYHEMHAFIHTHGLDPALGLLHTTENGRWSLALDLIEPFRPVVAEALTLDLFSHKILNASHFESRDGGVYLTREGRSKLILQYEKRMERQFMSEAAGHRTTLRQQLENQASQLKSSLESPNDFEPFLMN